MHIRTSFTTSLAVLIVALPLLVGDAAASGVVAEAEAGTGAGQVMTRASASGQRSVWLHAGETRDVPFTVGANGSYVFSVRYSNDNFGSLETVDVRADGTAVGRFTAQDTGDWGFGWNNFLWSSSLGPLALAPGSHRATIAPSGGDGYGVEIDAFRIDRLPDPWTVEGEAGGGDGVIQPRSAASGQRSLWLRANQARNLPLQISVAASYSFAMRYSNDNWGPLETVRVAVDGLVVGQFSAQDTGDFGAGWNVFVWSDAGSTYLSVGSHDLSVQVSGGDGYGVELDLVRVAPVL